MEHIKNEFQLSKTLRFGLTKKNKVKKLDYEGCLYESHAELDNLVKISIDRIKDTVSPLQDTALSLSLDKLKNILNMIADYLSKWSNIYYRTDQISLDKDYYKVLCKKIGFDGFWYDNDKTKKIKKPQARIINLSELEKKDNNGIKRKDYIISYWKENLLSISDKFELVTNKITQFEKALDVNRSNDKPNEVELRKCFISLLNLVKETLNPFCMGQILFPKLERIDSVDEDNQCLIDFAVDNKSKRELLLEISEIKKYFEENGGNVPYCRATLNPKTSIKNPKSTDTDIKSEISRLGIDKILEYKDANYYANYINNLSLQEKLKRIADGKISLVERCLLFKYKSVPAIVQYEISKTLFKVLNKNEDEVLTFLQDIGQQHSPTKDYADLQDKNDFNLEAYPIKVAFDFAWESLARSIYHKDANIPVEKCVSYLKHFDIDTNSKDFMRYAQLQELKAVLSTLEFDEPKQEYDFIKKANELISQIDWSEIGRNGLSNKEIIAKWLKNRTKDDDNFKIAKQQIGLYRGGLKNKNKKYKELTEIFKDISMKMGKTFAQMRDKITGAAELNKVTHFAMIVEDNNFDKYILLQKVVDKEIAKIYNKVCYSYKKYKTYHVNSVTSNAISKMIKKEKQMNNGLGDHQTDLTPEQRNARNVNEWKRFVIGKNYDEEFKLELKNKNDFEQIKKEIDSKCYQLVESYLDEDTLMDLIVNGDCLLLPIVNQDIVKDVRTENNQFTKDWNAIFKQNTPWRLTPEFRISYRKPTNDYPVSNIGDKRYSRFQIIAHFLCDYIPKTDSYVSNREQMANFKDDKLQHKVVADFNERLIGKTEEEKKNDAMNALLAMYGKQSPKQGTEKKKEKFYVFGIDRGQKELATLCVIDQDKKIIGGFDIYTRSFNSNAKRWEHEFLGTRHILDLSNLRVETTVVINGKEEKKKVLVDLSEVKVKDKNGNYVKPNKMQVKMQQLAYIRKLQFQMQTNPEVVLDWYEKNLTKELILENFVDKVNGEKGLVSFYGSAVEKLEDTLPLDRIEEMLQKFKSLKRKEKQGEDMKLEIDKLIQLEPVDNLKNGVVANMIGVIAYLLEKFDYQVYISIEDLSGQFENKVIGGIAGVPLSLGKRDGRRADVEKYAGLGLYNYFEMQLLKKLVRIQQNDNSILHLVPTFRAVKNYDHIAVGKAKVKNQFGIVFFVDANATSKTCPVCGTTNDKPNKTYSNAKKGVSKNGKEVWLERDKTDGNDIVRCFVCGFDTTKHYEENPLKFIKSGDDNAAYLISAEAIKAYELATTLVNNQ